VSSSVVQLRQKGSVLVITLNRPEVRNAINKDVAVALAAALAELDARPDLHVGIITGAGGTFCSGMDLKAFAAGGDEPAVEGLGFAGMCEAQPRKPLIAAVEGHAVAGGFEIALACDLIVAARNASFGLPEVKRGLVASSGGLMRLPRGVSRNIAMEMALRTWRDEEMFALQRPIATAVNRSADAREGATAFVQKRAPAWQGR
jgi:enoyl-CoA hydratase